MHLLFFCSEASWAGTAGRSSRAASTQQAALSGKGRRQLAQAAGVLSLGECLCHSAMSLESNAPVKALSCDSLLAALMLSLHRMLGERMQLCSAISCCPAPASMTPCGSHTNLMPHTAGQLSLQPGCCSGIATSTSNSRQAANLARMRRSGHDLTQACHMRVFGTQTLLLSPKQRCCRPESCNMHRARG